MDEETRTTFKDELTEKCVASKQSEAVITAIVETIAQNETEQTKKNLRLQQLEDFQFVLRHDFSSLECKNVNETRAQLMFKIRKQDGSLEVRRLEVSMDELRQIKKELIRIEETLS
jgi:hypothetical protein